MKKLLLLGVGSALMFTMSGMGSAQADSSGSIHKSTAALALEVQQVSVGGSRCAGCHRAHTAKAEKLLKMAQPALCYTCHGSLGSALDVVDGTDSNQSNAALRGGGFAYALINGGAASKTMPAVLDQYSHPLSETVPVLGAGAPVTSRHQIDGVTSGTMWGNGAISDTVTGALDAGKSGVTLECASCHDPHGNGNYRILKPVPNDAATVAVAAVTGVAGTPAVTTWTDTSGTLRTLPYTGPDGVVHPIIPAVAPIAAVVGVAAVAVLPVAIPDAIAKVYTTTDYWAVADRNVPTLHATADAVSAAGVRTPGVLGTAPLAGTTDGYITNVAAWCSTCHTRYLAGSGSYKTRLTDATTGKIDATFTYRHRSDRADKDGKNVPNCIQCHVSHGSNVVMGGSAATFTNPAGVVPGAAGASGDNKLGVPVGGTAIGTSRLLRVDNRGTCEMCHNV